MQYSKFEFRGDGITYLFYLVGSFFVTVITFYLAAPWMYCWRIKWFMSNVYVNSRKLTFTGSGIQVFGLFIWIFIATIFTLGLYLPFGKVRIEKWKWQNTFFEDEIYSNNTSIESPIQKNIDNKPTLNDFNYINMNVLAEKTFETSCVNCKSIIELDKEEISKSIFICPVCNEENTITSSNKIELPEGLITEKDFSCINCKSIITLEAEELISEKYFCPVCNTENKLD